MGELGNGRGFGRFLKTVLRHAANVYSVVALALALVALALALSGFSQDFLTPLSLALAGGSIIWAAYLSWKEQVPESPDLLIQPANLVVGAPVDGRLPQRAHLDLGVDVSNPGEKAVHLELIEVYKWGVPSTLFEYSGTLKVVGDSARRHGDISLPIEFPSDSRRRDLRVFVTLGTPETDESAFARTLADTNEFSVTLRFTIRDSAGLQTTREVEFLVDLESFKKMVLRKWAHSGHCDLIAAAGRIEHLL